jgi:hypothetical protein
MESNIFHNLLQISLPTLNLFSFVLGMLYTLSHISTIGNPRNLWLQVVSYFVIIALYFYLQTKL